MGREQKENTNKDGRCSSGWSMSEQKKKTEEVTQDHKVCISFCQMKGHSNDNSEKCFELPY